MEAVQVFKDVEILEDGTPLFKEKAIFFYDSMDQHRPEAKRFRKAVATFRSSKKKLILCPEGEIHPFYSTKNYKDVVKKFPDAQVCSYNPFLGVVPAEISDIFPASHNLAPRSGYRFEDYPTFIESLKEFAGRFEEIHIVAADDNFIKQAAKAARLNARIIDDISAL
jgi:7-cyano-7-deazaguanine tRNA-ribosyltransferase